MKFLNILLIWGIIFSLALSACGWNATTSSNRIEIEGAWARPGLKDGTGAIYFVMSNVGSVEDKMIAATSDMSDIVEMHLTEIDGGVMKMKMQPNVPIAAKGKVELKPGGLHLMQMKLSKDLKPNDSVKLTIRFEKAGIVEVSVPVKEP